MWHTNGEKRNVLTPRRQEVNGCVSRAVLGVKQVFFVLRSHLSHHFKNHSFHDHPPTHLDIRHCLSEIPTVKRFFLIEYCYYKRSLCLFLIVFFLGSAEFVVFPGCGAFFSHNTRCFWHFENKRIMKNDLRLPYSVSLCSSFRGNTSSD